MSDIIDDQMDALCDEYESLRTSSDSVSIAEFLGRVDAGSRAHLFRWLMRLERQWCLSTDESIRTACQFASQFPNYSAIVDDVFSDVRSSVEFPQIDNYEIKSFINQGGQGSVFEAIQVNTGQRVAIKLVEVSEADLQSEQQAKAIQFLKNEVRVLSALQHPNVVKIFDAGECERGFYYVMQYVGGGSLADRIENISQVDAADYIRQIASAVKAASDLGILHLDIKPGNILFDENSNQPLLTDFGLSQVMVGDGSTKAAGGTPAYMAPEQSDRGLVDHRTDIYGLGATLHTLVHGYSPHSESAPTKSVDTKKRNVNPKLVEIINRCLEKSPSRRYQRLSELLVDLEQFGVTKDARRVVQMGNRSMLTSPLYILINGIISVFLYFNLEEHSLVEPFTWLLVFSMYGCVFYTLSSARIDKNSAEEIVALESLYSLWGAKMMAAITIAVALRIFLGRIELDVHPARYTLLLSYPMFCALTGTITAAMAPRYWRKLYLIAITWWLYSILIIWVGTNQRIDYLVPILYGIAGCSTSLAWGMLLRRFAGEDSTPDELISVARTMPYEEFT